MKPVISVVIATVGRPCHLARSLAAYAKLDPATPPFEVIVALDGDQPPSRAVAERGWPFPVHVVSQPAGGTGPAKNLGASRAQAPYLLFLNDDTRPDECCLLAHWQALAVTGEAIHIGHVEWDPERTLTRYMTWLSPAGHQFNFSRLVPGGPAPWDACWGAHLGVPRSWFEEEPFDPRLSLPALEDIEWGFRQHRRGRPLRYLASAEVYHDHLYEGPGDYRRRARASGRAARYAARRHPELALPLVTRPMVAAATVTLLSLLPCRWQRETLWDLGFRWNYLAGLVRGQEDF